MNQNASVTVLQAASASQCKIDQVDSRAGCIWQRQTIVGNDGSARYLVVSLENSPAPHTIRFYDSLYNVELDHVLTGVWTPQSIVPITADKILIIGHGPKAAAGTTSDLAFCLLTINNSTWGGPTPVETYGGSFPAPTVPPVFDASGVLYFAGTNLADLDTDHVGSMLGRMTAADVLLTGGPRVSDYQSYPDFIIKGLVSISGVVYLIGSRIIHTDGGTRLRHQVIQYPRTVVWESRATVSIGSIPKKLIAAISQEASHEAFFVVPSSYGDRDSIMRISAGGAVEEVGCFAAAALAGSSENTWVAVAAAGRSFYSYNACSNTFQKYSKSLLVPCGPLDKPRKLEPSRFGANTPLIEKSLYSITIELDTVLNENDPLSVYVNDILVGTMKSTDGLRKELVVETDIVGGYFQPRLEISAASQWRGQLERIGLRYIPTQFKKKAWGFAVRVDLAIELLNGQRETRTPQQIYDDLEAAWIAKRPIELYDVDGKTYKVVVTDLSERRPLIATGVKDREMVVAVECLEA